MKLFDFIWRRTSVEAFRLAALPSPASPKAAKAIACFCVCFLVFANVQLLERPGNSSSVGDRPATDGPSPKSKPRSGGEGEPGDQASASPTVDLRPAANVTEPEFRRRYRHRLPLLLRPASGHADWLLRPDQWRLDSLLRQFGDYDALADWAIDIVRAGGAGSQRVNFGQFLRAMANASSMAESRYIFSRQFFRSTGLDSGLRLPQLIGYNNKDHDLFAFIGGNGSGVSFHKHAEAWNGVVSGRKRWFLFPAEATPPGGVPHAFAPADWLRFVLPRLPPAQRPYECVQEPGDILYIPEGFYHATINLEPTVAIGVQSLRPVTQSESLFYELESSDASAEESKLQKLQRLLPSSTEVLHRLAMVRSRMRKLPEAVRMLEEVLEKDPRFLVAMLELASLKWKEQSKAPEAEKLYEKAVELNPNYWESFARFAEFLFHGIGDVERAQLMLEKAAALSSSRLQVWQLLLSVHEFNGNNTAAAAAAAKISELSAEDQELVDF